MNTRTKQLKHTQAFSLVEVVLATIVLSVLLAGSLTTITASRSAMLSMQDRAIGTQLAVDLINEISQHPYEEIVDGRVISLDAGEAGPDRSKFDDVDDYHGWSASPPQEKDGDDIDQYESYTRSVKVTWVDTSRNTSGTETGMKLITVTVKRGSYIAAQSTILISTFGLLPTTTQQTQPDTQVSTPTTSTLTWKQP